jgi:hypothetical protein
MKIKMLRDVFVFKKGVLYDVIDYDDKKYIVLSPRGNKVIFKKNRGK